MSQQRLSKKKKALCILIGVAGIFLIGFLFNLYFSPSSPIETPLNQNTVTPSLDTTPIDQRIFQPVVLRDFSEPAEQSNSNSRSRSRSSSGGSSSGSGSNSGGSSTPSTQTPQQAPVVTLIRQSTLEDQRLGLGTEGIIFNFKVDSPSINDTFQVLNFTLSFRDSLTDAAIYHIKNRGHLTLQLKNARGGWDSLVTQTMSSYNGAQTHSFRIHVNPLSLRHNAEIRLLFTDAACELSGNAVNVKITNGNAVTFLTQLNSPLTYQESEHFIPFDNCNVPGKPASGSILWLRFEEPSGLITNNPFYDSSGKRNHIQTNVGVAQSQTCYVDKCVGFNANRQSYLEIPASDSLFTSDPISLEMNLYPEQGNTWQGLISKGNGVDAYDYHVALTPRNTVGFYTEQGSVWYESSRTIPLNAWTHLVVTIDDCETAPIDGAHLGCHLRMFINGVEDTIIVPPNANSVIEVDLGLPMGQSAINVGAWSGTARLYPYTGLIDNLIIYKKALSQTEVYQQLGSVGRV